MKFRNLTVICVMALSMTLGGCASVYRSSEGGLGMMRVSRCPQGSQGMSAVRLGGRLEGWAPQGAEALMLPSSKNLVSSSN